MTELMLEGKFGKCFSGVKNKLKKPKRLWGRTHQIFLFANSHFGRLISPAVWIKGQNWGLFPLENNFPNRPQIRGLICSILLQHSNVSECSISKSKTWTAPFPGCFGQNAPASCIYLALGAESPSTHSTSQNSHRQKFSFTFAIGFAGICGKIQRNGYYIPSWCEPA